MTIPIQYTFLNYLAYSKGKYKLFTKIYLQEYFQEL